ncbi:MAG: pyridoxal-phosphate dependent enzyme [Vulcanimicrobiaceae bacterium]
MEGASAVTFEDVTAAEQRLSGIAHRTPVLTSRTLEAASGARVFLKCENFQRMGAFKFRGAYNRLSRLSPDERARGVVSFSSGNHAQGVALAAQLLEMEAIIVMPRDAPRSKVEATRAYGAQIVVYDRAEEDREAIARRICAERNATLVPPYDDANVIAGQGTVALELLDQAGHLDMIVVSVGGGGLLSGCAIAANGVDPAIAVYGVEPETGNDFARSLAEGKRISIPVPHTIADGMQTQSPGAMTFPLVQRYAAGIVTVSDAELIEAMRFAFERMRMVVEPSGAAALAAVMHGRVPARGKRVGVVISGGNVDLERFAQIIAHEFRRVDKAGSG